MDTPSITLVKKDEIHRLKELSLTTFGETYRKQNTAENFENYCQKHFKTDQLISEMENALSRFYFLRLGEEPVGYIKLNFDGAQTETGLVNSLELERIYVLKKYHGNGFGKLLIKQALEVAKNTELDFVWLGVWEKNPNAIGFYEKQGFVSFDRHVFKLGDDLQTDIMMKYQF